MNMQPLNIVSAGRVACSLQLPWDVVRQTADILGIMPHMVNNVPHFNASDVERIAAHIRHLHAASGAGPLADRRNIY